MATAMTLKAFLSRQGVAYEEVGHPRAVSASRIAQQAHVPGDKLAKAVLINGDSGYRVLVIPSTCRADLGRISHELDERIGLATEGEIGELFPDCDTGALPPIGQAYGLRVCCDDALVDQADIYCEAGDHETLVHLRGEDFGRLMAEAEHGHFSRHM